MQPYFFPYLGYYALIKHTDRFIVFDTPQFIRHGWIERNRILKQNGNWLYIKVPLERHPREESINNLRIRNAEKWREVILAQLTPYKKIAPNYFAVLNLVKECLSVETDSITALNVNILKLSCQFLDIPFNYEIFSRMHLNIPKPSSPDEWALNICLALGNVDEYVNASGGKEFFHIKKYHDQHLKITFLKLKQYDYDQRRDEFESDLSVIDALMFLNPRDITEILDNTTTE